MLAETNKNLVKNSYKDRFLTRAEAAKFLGVQPQTLSVWASTKRYKLKYIKIGSRVFYSKAHLDEFIEMNTFCGEGEQ